MNSELELLAYWVHDLDPVAFQLTERLAIHWYGVAYVSGFALAWILLRLYYRRGLSPLDSEGQETLFFAGILGVLLGGRLGYMFLYDLDAFLANPLILFRVWEGGMASHGGFVGVILAAVWVSRKTNISLLKLGDIIVTLVPGGLFFGRIANFVNGELWGKVSEVSWAVIFPRSAANGTPVEWIAARHPSQLYEAALEGLFLFLYVQGRFWLGRKRPDGQLAGEFYILYAIVRIIGEQFREPDAELILGMSRGIFYSWFILLVGVGIILWSRRASVKKNE